ncbi:hypothetical protein ACWGFX_21080 [Streptomyces xanthophaeus]
MSKPAVPVSISLERTRWVTTPASRSCCTGTARAAYEAPMPVNRGRRAARSPASSGEPSWVRTRAAMRARAAPSGDRFRLRTTLQTD